MPPTKRSISTPGRGSPSSTGIYISGFWPENFDCSFLARLFFGNYPLRERNNRMRIDQIRNEFETLELAVADGPIVPNVTAEQIRAHLSSRFNFTEPIPLDEVVADVEKMLSNWQV